MEERVFFPEQGPDFSVETLKAIKAFNDGIEGLKKDFPDIFLKEIRDFLKTGESDLLPEEVKRRAKELNDIRKESIEFQLSFVKDQAYDEGKEIPEEYVTGEALDVFFSPETYNKYFDFWVFRYFSWFEPWEEAQLLTESFFSI